ncbi:MAG: DUF2971 domain-containing protein [Ginsengibacter sp.]
MKTGEENFKILKQYVEKVIKPHFKIDFAGHSSYSKVGDSIKFTGTIELPTSSISYKQTDYYYSGNREKFIHFTSLNTFFKIIDCGHFLASQFTNHDDPLELIYAGIEMLHVTSKEKLEQFKELLFSLSMCIYDTDEDSFDMWRLYGDNGNGVGIVFSFYPNRDYWKNSFLSPVYYGNDSQVLERFKNFSEDHIIFMQSQLTFTMLGNVWGESGIPDSIALFLAFHKNAIFHTENELRFLKSFLTGSERCDEANAEIGIVLDKKNNLHYTYKIPLLTEKNILLKAKEKGLPSIKNFRTNLLANMRIFNEYVGNSPFIIIEKVILGYRYTQEDLIKIRRTRMIVEGKTKGMPIEFQLSHLSKKFHGR